ncbi:hypothetical protein LC605_32815, partial [Nostoc sp. CHAB 5836]|uniref:hypothetical protein n=1 Tax=Nostoc sp. CHAB 5836 TaxID=2780404 RepID=UPI001E5A3CE9
YGSSTFSISPIISDMEKVFAKKLGFGHIKRAKFLILDKVELRFTLQIPSYSLQISTMTEV